MQTVVHLDAMAAPLLDSIADKRVVLCVGPGGVGKTTSSAALALAAAMRGKRVLVLTIDPARRLADALGVGLNNEPTPVDTSALRAAGVPATGSLHAVMLDPSRTFDDVVDSLSPNPEHARRFRDNVVYRQLSRHLAGGIEYTAVEKLYTLATRGDFDLIVVDTPPSKNVIDFIEAPRFLSRFLDERVLRLMLVLDPSRGDGKKGLAALFVQRTSRLVGDVLGKVLGAELVQQIVGFLRGLEAMAEKLRAHCDAVAALLQSDDTAFLVVTSPDPVVLRDAAALRRELSERHIPFGGFVINRVEQPSGIGDRQAALAELLAAGAADDASSPDTNLERLTTKLGVAIADLDARAARDAAAVADLREQARWQGPVATLPRELQEVHDLSSLSRLSLVLSGG